MVDEDRRLGRLTELRIHTQQSRYKAASEDDEDEEEEVYHPKPRVSMKPQCYECDAS